MKMAGSNARPAAVSFGVAMAVIVSWFFWTTVSDFLDSRQVVIDSATIRYNILRGDWSVNAYNGSARPVTAILVRITVPVSEVRRTFRLDSRGLLGISGCPPYSVGEFRGSLGGFLPDRKIHGLWKLVGVEFGKTKR